ncbi:MAG: uroporphyrinogen-III C-methyltransferase [Deltaproteobacteria bacterium]|nr:uroporphyrinogen-III C-methyltransferase [Deltaproteobacteria bacterium]
MGKVYLVGAGPGDPELITLKGIRTLRRSDVVLYDHLANPELLAYAPSTARKIDVGKEGGGRSMRQDRIIQKMIQLAQSGKIVVRLKGGDPFLFGRGGEEAEALAEVGIFCEVIPGVTSAIAVPAYAGIPVTHRRFASAVTIATGHEDPEKSESILPWIEMARAGQTLVLLMGVKTLKRNVGCLLSSGCDPKTPVALIQWGTYPQQRTVIAPLNQIVAEAKKARVGPPSVMVVGEVVSLRGKIGSREERPLLGKRILVTRAREQASEFVDRLKNLGAESIEIPAVDIQPPKSWKKFDSIVKETTNYDWVIFTSVNGVRAVADRLRKLGLEFSKLFRSASICAIGPRTAEEIELQGLKVKKIPSEYRAESILEAFGSLDLKGKSFLIPRSEIARDLLPRELQKRGAKVDVVDVYRTVPSRIDSRDLQGRLKNGEIDVLTFTSSSTVHSLARHFGRKGLKNWTDGAVVACIGPITEKTARSYGLRSEIVAKKYTIGGLTQAIVDYFKRGGEI